MTKTCLVTGCAGFIGSHLTQILLDAGHSVVGVDNIASGYAHNMEGFIDHAGFTFYERSIVEENLLVDLKHFHPDLDVIFQLAAVVSVPYSVEHPELTMQVNFEANRDMLDVAKELGISSFVFAGSAAEYGNEDRLPVKEEYAAQAEQLSPYGVAKYKSSEYIAKSGYGCSLRFFNIFGPRQDPTSQYSGVISRFVDFGLSGKNMVIFGDGEQTRDFLYVSDVVTSYFIAAGLDEHGRGPLTGIYNVGTGIGRSVRELATIIAGLTSAPEDIDFKPERAGDIKHSCADVSKLSAEGFKAEVSFENGLARTVDWAIRSKSQVSKRIDMQEVEQTTTLNPQVKDAAVKYVRHLFSQADDSDFIRLLKKEAFKNVYKKMIVEPDEFMPQPRPADVGPWEGPKPESPKDFLKSKLVLPSLPQVLLEIQKVVKDPDSSADDLATIINKDPKLVAAILRLANSAMFSFRTEVDTTSRAVALLGFKQASSLALGTVSLSLFKRSEGAQVLQVEKFWKHAIACGVIAQEIAKLAGFQDCERFFVAGMLHDIGLYVIFESDKSLGLELSKLARINGNSLYDAEMELLGFSHAALGGVILKDWNFPKSLVVAAAAHHNPAKAKKDPDAGIIHVADFISRALGYHLGLSPVLGVLDQKIYESFGLSGEMFVDMIPEVQKLIEEILEILNPA